MKKVAAPCLFLLLSAAGSWLWAQAPSSASALALQAPQSPANRVSGRDAAQATPSNPSQAPESAAAQKLRERAEALYTLFVSGDWVKVEPFLTEESRNAWYAGEKEPLLAYRISSVQVDEKGTHGQVTAMVTWRTARVAQPITTMQRTEWVEREGEWRLLLPSRPGQKTLRQIFSDPTPVKVAPPPAVFEPSELHWKEGMNEARIPFTIVGEVQGPAHVMTLHSGCTCLKAKLAKEKYSRGEKGELLLERDPAVPWPSDFFQSWILFDNPSGVAALKVFPPEKNKKNGK